MSIKSYLVYSVTNRFGEMVSELGAIPGVQVHPADCGGMAIVVTDTADRHVEDQLQKRLSAVDSIQSMALVFGQELTTKEAFVC